MNALVGQMAKEALTVTAGGILRVEPPFMDGAFQVFNVRRLLHCRLCVLL